MEGTSSTLYTEMSLKQTQQSSYLAQESQSPLWTLVLAGLHTDTAVVKLSTDMLD